MILQIIKKVLLILLITLIPCILLLRYGAAAIRTQNIYTLKVIDKEKRLSELPSPRLVFLGGSNLVFSLDCARISDSLKLPVVNMALQAGLGLSFMLKETADNAKKGDKIIVSSEYYLSAEGNKKLFALLIDTKPSIEKYCVNNLNDKIRVRAINLQRIISGLFYRKTLNIPERGYDINKFTIEGDNVTHLEMPSMHNFKSVPTIEISDYSLNIALINKFIQEVRNKGAEAYYMFPCYPETQYLLNKEAILDFEKQLRIGLNCIILNSPQTFLYPDDYFFDTVYHLNKKGRAVRTNQLCEILKGKL